VQSCSNHPEITTGVTACARCGGAFCESCVVLLQGAPFCAPCKVERLRDVHAGVAPLRSGLDLASRLNRLVAVVVDALLITVPASLLMLPFMFELMATVAKESEPSLKQILKVQLWSSLLGLGVVAVAIVYEALMVRHRGQTLGKMLMGVRVVTADGRHPTLGQCWARAAVRGFLKSIPLVGYPVNYLPAFFTTERTCLHDMAARTRVVVAR
jgi:uncharacterized RDD family membrane protein YckC